jgi:L-arabinonolactonase
MPKSPHIECVVDAKARLGEGTCWDPQAQCLWWIDIHSKLIHRYDPGTGESHSFQTPSAPGCLALRQKGGLILAMQRGFYFFDPDLGRVSPAVTSDITNPSVRMNDGKTDRQGRFWAGSVFESETETSQPLGALYRLDTDLSCHRVCDNITCFNGLAWSPDSRVMYFTDSATPYVWSCDFDPNSGEITNRRIFIDLSSIGGVCDGATVDAEGCYWLTVPFKGLVLRFDPAGKLITKIELPTDVPTCCEFGGSNLDTLYVTSATLGRSQEDLQGQQSAGGLFAIDVGVRGLPASRFLD